ncbi:hypothetical protein PSEEN2866 [Pseudomonas entomophila L48]|uniref:Uncharacterized protein n=1 Tax=Pseudomonas entomophila (strain L48) TaxID=384676 RepID=Q1I9N3_PSEE4|nr:hypothetical protein PSEEN2866 [Pseudomonas entomophila L48]
MTRMGRDEGARSLLQWHRDCVVVLDVKDSGYCAMRPRFIWPR